ncbi:alpha/beta fold hydrolase [Geodermatophilus amargosae]|uniref:alpha/beta fold hydrolase n=1 Tax=Geodermatophilus amargosae TaxID=1296565 RepID=UPI0034DE33B9
MPEARRARIRRLPMPPSIAPSSTARTSTAALPSTDPPPDAWPGEEVPVRGGSVYVRTTPWAGTPGGPRERALYVHGLGGASTNWTDLAALLAVRCAGWAVDLPGFGRSQPPSRGSYSVRGHVRAVIDVLEHVRDRPGEGRGAPVHLLGNSLGGLVSLLVAARRPDLVATLTLVSPAMPVYRVPQAFGRALLLLLLPGVPTIAERRLAGVTPEQSVRGMLQMCFGEPARVPPARIDAAVEETRERAAQEWANRALTRSMRGLITSYLRVGRANAWRLASSLRMPTLVVWGDRDRLVDPRLAPRLAAVVPRARLLVLETVGHVAMLEAPEETARAVLGMLEDLTHPSDGDLDGDEARAG